MRRLTQLQTLALIDRYPDGVIASDIAHEFGITIRAAEGRLDRLAAAELITDYQIPWPTGGLILARLTDKGRAALQEGEVAA